MVFGLFTLLSALGGLWWRLEAKFKSVASEAELRTLAAHTKADFVSAELASYKTYVAENYATNAGVTREFEAVTKAISEVGQRVESRLDGMSHRLDRVIESNSKPVHSSRSRTP